MSARRQRRPGVVEAATAALLFGGATPFASRLAGSTNPPVLAGLLYLGSGIVLAASMLIRPSRTEAPLQRGDLAPLAGAIAFGGGLAPLLLVVGLERTTAATASLLLNLEVVFTALLAWLVFRDGVTRRVGFGLAAIVGGALLVSWQPGRIEAAWGALAIAGACACWALDNNLTQLVSAKDPRQIAMLKGVIAGSCNLTIGLAIGGALPGVGRTAGAVAVGVFGYGVSLMLFVTALRNLGTARTGAIFAVGPFVGVVVAIVGFGEPLRWQLVPAGACIALGVWLQLTEHHSHEHRHERLVHAHRHVHDDGHHDHEHPAGMVVDGPHSHEHVHEAMVHTHEHRPDIHHRHRHR